MAARPRRGSSGAFFVPGSGGGAEADDSLVVVNQRAEADGEPDFQRVERNVHGPAEQGHALIEAYHGHGVRRLGRAAPRRNPDDGETGDGAVSGEGNGFPRPLVTGGAELLRRNGEFPAATATDAGEPTDAGFFEEGLQRDHFTHCRRDSPGRWRCCRRGCARVRSWPRPPGGIQPRLSTG